MKKIIIITILLLVGCGADSTIENPQQENMDYSAMKAYSFANSTDIYNATGIYALDGTGRKGLYLVGTNGLDYSILCVNDKWLYYYFDDDEGTGNLKRVPLRKGKDKRDIMNTEHVENVRDTQYENGFTVVGDYYAGISYGTVAIVYNMNTKETVRHKVPKELAYSHEVETEDKYWQVLQQGDDWVIWENSKGVMLQEIPSGKMKVIEKGNGIAVLEKKKNSIIYSTDNRSCFQYDIEGDKKEIVMKEEQICSAVEKGLGVSEADKVSFSIDDLMVKDDQYYMQLKVKVTKANSMEHKYVMLSQREGENGLFEYDETLNAILKKYTVLHKKKKGKKKVSYANNKFVMNVERYWFLQDRDSYCYDAKTNTVKKIDNNDPEWRICFADSTFGLGYPGPGYPFIIH